MLDLHVIQLHQFNVVLKMGPSCELVLHTIKCGNETSV